MDAPAGFPAGGVVRSGALLFLALAAGLVGQFILLFEYWFGEVGEAEYAFVHGPWLLLWLTPHVVQFMIVGCASVYLWSRLAKLGMRLPRDVGRLLAVAIPSFLLMVLPFVLTQELWNPASLLPIEAYRPKMAVLLCLTFVGVVLPGVVRMWLASSDAGGASTARDPLERFFDASEEVTETLRILAVILAIGILGIAASRQVILSLHEGAVYPSPLLVAYGGYNSFILGLFYAPAHFQLSRAARTIRAQAAELREGPTGLLEAIDRQGRVMQGLGWNVDLWQRLQSGLSVVAPLLAGLGSALLQ